MSNSASQIRNLISTGATKTTGGNRNIAPGVLAVVDKMEGGSEGLKLVANFAAYQKDEPRFILVVGEKETADSRTSVSHDSASQPFSIDQIVSVGVATPKVAEAKVDELRFGYDGHDPLTTIELKQGMQPLHIRFELSEGSIPYSGGGRNSEVIDIVYDFNESNAYNACTSVDDCDPIDCKPVMEDIVRYIKRREIGGGRKLEEIIEVFPISSCADELGADPYSTFDITVCDTGDANSLAAVQADYDGKVVLYRRSGSNSTYRIMIEGTTPPTAFTPTTSGMMPVCDVCANGETATEGGFLYYFTVEDNGTDATTAIEAAITGEVAGATSVVEKQGNSFGKGTYSVVIDEKVSWNDMQAIVVALEGDNGITTVKELGELAAFCAGEELDPVTWTLVETCFATEKSYTISLGDDECGNDKLAILQASYPEATIEINVGAGTTGCMHTYTATLPTNIQCEDCDESFVGLYEAKLPTPFEGNKWKEVPPVAGDTDCLCGFGIRGKLFKITPDKTICDNIGYVEDSVRILGAAGGYHNRGYLDGRTDYSDEISVVRISEKQSRDHVAGNLINKEIESGYYFQDKPTHWNSSLQARWSDLESRFTDLDAQYLNYWVKVNHSKLAGHLNQQISKTIIYNVYVEVGKQAPIESLINEMASAKGVPGVKAY